MDASLVLAVDGLRMVAQTASDVVVAHNPDSAERATIAVASDVETACLNVLGRSPTPVALPPAPAVGASPAKRAFLTGLGLLGLGGGGGGEEAPGTPSAGAGSAADGGGLSVETGAAGGMTVEQQRAWTAAQLSPITDIIVVTGSDPLPAGFSRIATSVTGAFPADLNSSSGAKQSWLAVARMPNATPITALAIVMLELGEFIPPSFQPVRYIATGRPANLRFGASTSGEGGVPATEAYLCFARHAGAPIVDLGLCFPSGAYVKPQISAILPGSGAATLNAGEHFLRPTLPVPMPAKPIRPSLRLSPQPLRWRRRDWASRAPPRAWRACSPTASAAACRLSCPPSRACRAPRRRTCLSGTPPSPTPYCGAAPCSAAAPPVDTACWCTQRT